jgi:hypothetical protein
MHLYFIIDNVCVGTGNRDHSFPSTRYDWAMRRRLILLLHFNPSRCESAGASHWPCQTRTTKALQAVIVE